MPYVLHDNPLSSNAQKVRFLLAELGETAELRERAVRASAARLAPRRQPARRHPRARPRRLPRWPSRTPCCAIIATRSGDTQIYPSDLPDRATVNWLLDAIATFLRPALLSDRGGRVRRACRPRHSAPSRPRPTAARRRSRGAAEARALPGPARRRLAVGLLRPLHDRRRGGDAGAPPPARQRPAADRHPAPRGLGRGLLRAARPGPAWRRRRASRRAGRPRSAARRIEASTSSCGMPGHWKRKRKLVAPRRSTCSRTWQGAGLGAADDEAPAVRELRRTPAAACRPRAAPRSAPTARRPGTCPRDRAARCASRRRRRRRRRAP